MSYRSQPAPTIISKIAPYLVVLLAFWLQMSYLVELQATFPAKFGQEPFCGVDAIAHVERSYGLLDGSVPGNKVFYFTPLYPFFLIALRETLGPSLLLPVFGQALFQIAGLAALYRLGRLTFSPLTGLLAMLGLAVYGYYIFYLPCFDQTLLTTPALTLLLFFLINYHLRPKAGYMLGAGLMVVIATLSRPTVLVTLPLIIIWLFYFKQEPWPKLALKLALLVVPLTLAIFPFTRHNYQVSGKFLLLSDNFGINLFTGNNPDAYGMDSLAHAPSQPAVLRFLETVDRVHRDETTFVAEALKFMAEQPADALALTLEKARLWFIETDKILIEPFFPLTIAQTKWLAFLAIEWQALAVVALLGLVFVRGRSRPLILLLWLVYGAFSLFTIIFFIQLRFRLPFVPFVMLYAAALPAAAPGWGRQRQQLFWAILALLLLLLLFIPGLAWFVVLFAGLGLWPQFRQAGWAAAIILYVILVGIWHQANTLAADVAQEIDIYLGPPLAGAGMLGQTFQMDCNGLNQIEITLGTFGDNHNQPVIFTLAADSSAEEILYSETFAGESVTDYQRRRFTFNPIPNSAGRTFFFFVASPTSTPDNAITARGYSNVPIDYYPAGNGFIGRPGAMQPLEADFAFVAYCDVSFWQKIEAVFTQ